MTVIIALASRDMTPKDTPVKIGIDPDVKDTPVIEFAKPVRIDTKKEDATLKRIHAIPENYTGIWEEHCDGVLVSQVSYRNSKKNGLSFIWYENGQLEFEYSYQDDKKHGRCRFWSDKGQLISDFVYEHDKYMDGVNRQWYRNGQLKYEIHYKQEAANSLYRGWARDGSLNFISYQVKKENRIIIYDKQKDIDLREKYKHLIVID